MLIARTAKYIQRAAAALAAMILIAAVCAVATETPASAAWKAPCVGTACKGLDPDTKGCGNDPNVKTVDYVRPAYGTDDGRFEQYDVQLRYSPGCKAAWARGIVYDQCSGSNNGMNARVYSRQGSSGNWVSKGHYTVDLDVTSCPDYQTSDWTKMEPASTGFQVAVCRVGGTPATAEPLACTSYQSLP